MAGIPPLNGFWSKLIIIVACVQSGFLGFAAVAVVMSIVTLAYQLKVQRYVFFGPRPAGCVSSSPEPPLMAAAMILLTVACVGLSLLVFSGLGNPWLITAAEQTLLAGVFDF